MSLGNTNSFAKGPYIPINRQKYIGTNIGKIVYRSSWELKVMQFFDNHPSVLYWMSESISIPYKNPLAMSSSKLWSLYIPDFFVMYTDKSNNKHSEIVEVKPAKEMPGFQGKVPTAVKLIQAQNAAKWQAAMIYCHKRNWFFRVINEKQLFSFVRKN